MEMSTPESGVRTPLETIGGAPITRADPQHITVAVAHRNEMAGTLTVSNPLENTEIGLLRAATEVWESLANVNLEVVADSGIVPDISVGLADFGSLNFAGEYQYSWNANRQFLPGSLLAIQDPAQKPVSQLANGDLRYDGFTATIFQDFLHELGHALGLAHNTGDTASIMNPVLGSTNAVPDAQDAAAVQSLYGAPTQPLTLSATDCASLHSLLADTALSSLA